MKNLAAYRDLKCFLENNWRIKILMLTLKTNTLHFMNKVIESLSNTCSDDMQYS